MSDKDLLVETHSMVQEIKQYLAVNDVKLENLTDKVKTNCDDIKDLTAYKNKSLGVTAILVIVFTAIGTFISKLIN